MIADVLAEIQFHVEILLILTYYLGHIGKAINRFSFHMMGVLRLSYMCRFPVHLHKLELLFMTKMSKKRKVFLDSTSILNCVVGGGGGGGGGEEIIVILTGPCGQTTKVL
jgi:hypothetical protein